MGRSFEVRGEVLLVVLLATLFVALSLPNLDRPGLYYDEAYDAAVAVDILSVAPPQIPVPSFSFFGFRLPLKTYGWGGALKVYLFLPLFSLFGPSVTVMRIMNLCVGVGNIALTYCLARRFLARFPSFVVSSLLVLDPNFIFETRVDWEPSSFAYLFRVAGSFFLAEGWLKREKVKMALSLACFALGVYNRVTFHIFFIPFCLSLFLFFRKEIRQGFKERFLSRKGVGCFVLIVAMVTSDSFRHLPFGALPNLSFARRASLFMNFLQGKPLVKQMLGKKIGSIAGGSFFGALLCLTFFLAWCYPFSKTVRKEFRGVIGFLTALLFGMGAFLFLLPGVRYGCHFFILYPFLQLMMGVLIQGLLKERMVVQKKITSLLLAFYLVFVSVTAISGYRVVQKASRLLVQTGGNGFWSDAIYDLATYLSERENREVVCLDWGFQRNLFVLTKGKIRLPEPFWPWVLEGKEPTEELHRLFSEKGDLYLLHEPRYTKLVEESQAKNWAKEAGFELERLKTFHQKTGEAVFSLYEARRFPGDH